MATWGLPRSPDITIHHETNRRWNVSPGQLCLTSCHGQEIKHVKHGMHHWWMIFPARNLHLHGISHWPISQVQHHRWHAIRRQRYRSRHAAEHRADQQSGSGVPCPTWFFEVNQLVEKIGLAGQSTSWWYCLNWLNTGQSTRNGPCLMILINGYNMV